MADARLLLDAAFIGAFGAAYVAVGARVARRRLASRDGQRAVRTFAAWWWGVAGLFLLSALSSALRGLGVTQAGVHVAVALPSMLSLCVGLFGILHFVTYLVSGRVVIAPFAVYYTIIFLALMYGVVAQPAEALAWTASVSHLTIQTGPLLTGAIVAFLVPVIGACAFYFALFFRVHDPEQKLRVGATAAAFILWFGSAILASALGMADEPAWVPVGRGIGIVATLLVLVGYWPPRGLRARMATRAARKEEASLTAEPVGAQRLLHSSAVDADWCS